MIKVLTMFLLLVWPVLADDLPSPAKPPAASPAITKDALIGTWNLDMEVGGAHVKGATEYKADGTLQGRATFVVEEEKIELAVKGTWKLDGKTLTTTVTESNNLEMIPVGEVSDDEILELSATKLRYRDEEGIEITETRQESKTAPKTKSPGRPVPPDDIKAIHTALETMQRGFREGNFDGVVKATHPSLITLAGGEEKFRESMEGAVAMLKSGRLKMDDEQLDAPAALYEAGEDWVCFVPKRSTLEFDGQKVRSQGFYVAIKKKSDREWKFLDGAGLRNNPERLWTLLPDLPQDVEIPPVKRERLTEE